MEKQSRRGSGGFSLIRKGLSIKLSHAARPLQRDVDHLLAQVILSRAVSLHE
jgi:hypothetical protein